MNAQYSPLKKKLLKILMPLHERGLDPSGFADEIESMLKKEGIVE